MRTIGFCCTVTAILFAGCAITTKPSRDLGFNGAAPMATLAGCYENKALVGTGGGPMFLSAIIWPSMNLTHKDITALEVLSLGDNQLKIAAFGLTGLTKEQVFTAGKDFTMDAGQIKISRVFGSAASESGNAFIGAGRKTVTLGIDVEGNGRAESSASFAGAAFLVIPLVGNVTDIGRFVRNPTLCTQQK